MTSPEVTPAQGDTDDETVHLWCDWCEKVPRKAICGEDLAGHERREQGKVNCAMCLDLESTHRKVLHP